MFLIKFIFSLIVLIVFFGCHSANSTDNSTQVTGEITIEVPENSKNVLSIVAQKGSILTLKGKNADKFELNDLVLAFKKAPDYEEDIHTYYVTVVISNNSTTTTQDYKIILLNENDNPPVFTAYTTVDVNENIQKVQELTASDLDGDSVKFSLDLTKHDDSDQFIIDDNNLLKLKEKADYEKKSSYLCTVILDDGKHTVEKTIKVNILNLADGVAILKPISFSIKESVKIGSKIATIPIKYSGDSEISSISLDGTGYKNFKVSKDGEIKLTVDSDIDYEKVKFYHLKAVATNKAGDSKPVDVNITIENVLDEVPILKLFKKTIKENDHLNKYLGDVEIVDAGDSPIEYFRVYGDGSNNFTVSKWGEVFISSSANLDYETKNEYKLKVVAKNKAGESDPAGIHIILQDYKTDPFEIMPLKDKDLEIGDEFGRSVDIDGSYLVVGSPYDDDMYNTSKIDTGSAYLYRKYLDGSVKLLKRLEADDKESYDLFGTSVAISGDYIVVGAYKEDDSADAAGSVYVFKHKTDSDITQIAKIQADDADKSDWFGFDVDIDGKYIVVGAYKDDIDSDNKDTGAAYLFEIKDDNNITQLAKITAEDDNETNSTFGRSVAIYDHYIVVGAKDKNKDSDNEDVGAVYLYKFDNDANVEKVKKIVASNGKKYDHFGNSVDIYGNYIVVGAYQKDKDDNEDVGAVYLYKIKSETNIDEIEIIYANEINQDDSFGSSVSIYKNYIVIGTQDRYHNAYQAGSASLFEIDRDDVEFIKEFYPHNSTKYDRFGKAVAIDGNNIVVGTNRADRANATNAGRAYLFDLEPKLRPYIYNIDNYYIDYKEEYSKTKIQEFEIVSPVSDIFDVKIISGDDQDKLEVDDKNISFVDVADYEEPLDKDENNQYDFGLKVTDSKDNYFIAYKSINVKDRKYLKVDKKTAKDIEANDDFGYSVDISGSYIIVGSPKDNIEDEDDAGSAYLFKENNGDIKQIAKLKLDDAKADDMFGSSVNIYSNYIFISAPQKNNSEGRVYVFKRDGSDVSKIATLKADDASADSLFGSSVAFYKDYLIVASVIKDNSKGGVYIFKKDDDDNFNQVDKLDGDNDLDYFGSSVAIDGKKFIVGIKGDDTKADNAGAAVVYEIIENDDGTYKELDKIDDVYASDASEDDNFGVSVSIDDEYALVGADRVDNDSGKSYLYKINSTSVDEKEKFQAPNKSKNSFFGSSVAIYSGDDVRMVVGAKNAKEIGAVYFYKYKDDGDSDTDDLVYLEKFSPKDAKKSDNFGASVAMYRENVIVGAKDKSLNATNGGVFYMFKKDSNQE